MRGNQDMVSLNCSPPKGIYLLNIIITLQCWTPQQLNPRQCTLSFLKWCFHLDKACNYTSWLGHCSQELQLIYDELPPFVNHVVRLWIKTDSLPLLLTPSLPSTDSFALLLLPSMHTCVAKPKTQQSEREKCHVHSGDIATRKEIWEFCSSLISLWDLLGVVLWLGFPSMHFRPLKLPFLTSKIVIFLRSCQLSDQWHLLRVPGLKLWPGQWFPAQPMSCVFSRAQITALATDPTQDSPSLFTPQFHWTSAENSPSFHRTSGNEVCSCWLTGKCWLGQGRWDEKIHREEKWCEKN